MLGANEAPPAPVTVDDDAPGASVRLSGVAGEPVAPDDHIARWHLRGSALVCGVRIPRGGVVGFGEPCPHMRCEALEVHILGGVLA